MTENTRPQLKKGVMQLVDEAMSEVVTLTVDEAAAKVNDPNVLFVDIRDARELDREGQIPSAFNVNRGMLEFWVDPASPYFKEPLGDDREKVLYCAGGWRSALAAKTLQDMGISNVSHIEGGFGAWKEAGKPIVDRERHGKK